MVEINVDYVGVDVVCTCSRYILSNDLSDNMKTKNANWEIERIKMISIYSTKLRNS